MVGLGLALERIEGELIYETAKTTGILIGSNITGEALVSCVKGLNESVFLDFNHNQTQSFWNTQLAQLDNKYPFDGLELELNQIGTLITSELLPCSKKIYSCKKKEKEKEKKKKMNEYKKIFSGYDLPYWPGNECPEKGSLSLNATHARHGRYINREESVLEYDMHSLNGLL